MLRLKVGGRGAAIEFAENTNLYEEMLPYAQKAFDLYSQETTMKTADEATVK